MSYDGAIVHASFNSDQVTYCGLSVWDVAGAQNHHALPLREWWHLHISCPECLEHEEVKAAIVEHALSPKRHA